MLNPAGKARYPLCGDDILEDDIDGLGVEKNMTVSEKDVQQLRFNLSSRGSSGQASNFLVGYYYCHMTNNWSLTLV